LANARTKYIFVTGGVVSSLGKGLASSSIGALLESRGLKVTFLKFDPYINVDPGTITLSNTVKSMLPMMGPRQISI